MEVLWLKSHGLTHDQIAASADVSRSTVQRDLDQSIEGGLPHLRQGHWHQPRSALAEHEDSPTGKCLALASWCAIRGRLHRIGRRFLERSGQEE